MLMKVMVLEKHGVSVEMACSCSQATFSNSPLARRTIHEVVATTSR